VTAGASLFHVVVDTDQTASKLVEVMMREKTGRVTFIPLNRIKPKPVTFPEAGDAIPLIQKLKYHERHEKAFQQVFGKTCVCQDLTVAAAYVRSHDLNTITRNGDKVDRKGALTGGYYGNRSRLDAIKNVKQWSAIYETDSKRFSEVRAAITQIEQRISQIVGELQVLTLKRQQAQSSRDPLGNEAMQLHRESDELKVRIERLETNLIDLETEARNLQTRKNSLKEELKQPLVNALTDAEAQELEFLGKEVDQRQKSLIEMSRRKSEVGLIRQISLNDAKQTS